MCGEWGYRFLNLLDLVVVVCERVVKSKVGFVLGFVLGVVLFN